MFHDYAFPEIGTLTDRCFAVAGAEARGAVPRDLAALARSCATTSSTRSASTSTPGSPASGARVQHLAHDGIALDVVGMRGLGARRAPGPSRVVREPPPPRLQRARRHVDEAARQAGPGLSRPGDVPDRIRAGAEAEPVGAARKADNRASDSTGRREAQLTKGAARIDFRPARDRADRGGVRRRRRQHVDHRGADQGAIPQAGQPDLRRRQQRNRSRDSKNSPRKTTSSRTRNRPRPRRKKSPKRSSCRASPSRSKESTASARRAAKRNRSKQSSTPPKKRSKKAKRTRQRSSPKGKTPFAKANKLAGEYGLTACAGE